MLDIVAVVLLILMFALAVFYTAGCERLKGKRS